MTSRELPYARYDPSRCLNCGEGLTASAKYCPICGQRNRVFKKGVVQWLAEGLSTFFHLEGRTWRTLRDLPVPGRMARNYLNGQRDRYIHPLRLLLLSSLVCFAVMRLTVGGGGPGFVHIGGPAHGQDIEQQAELKAGFDEAIREASEGEDFDLDLDSDDLPAAQTLLDSAINAVVEASVDGDLEESEAAKAALDKATARLAEVASRQRRNAVFGIPEDDTMRDPMLTVDRLRMDFANHDRISALTDAAKQRVPATDTLARALFDSIALAFPEPQGTYLPDTLLYSEATEVNSRQYASMSPREVVQASGLESWVNRVALAKLVQINQAGQQSINEALLANLTWAVLLFMPLLAFGYWLLYWRRLTYYSQHLNVVAITMSVGLLIGALGIVAYALGASQGWTWAVTVALFYGYVLATEIRIFEVAWWKALLKGFVLGIYGAMALSLAMTLWVAITVLLS